MKYKVIGWTEYDNTTVEAERCSEAALRAIIRDIAEHGYLFTGWDHQESLRCAPVLNDGKKRLFTQRSFGGVMARAHGDYSRMGYATYAFDWMDGEKTVKPPAEREFIPGIFAPEALNEEITLSVSQEEYAAARADGLLVTDDVEALDLLDVGDTLTLLFDGERASYLVADVERKKDLTEDEEIDILAATYTFDPEKMREANERYEKAKWLVHITLNQMED